jgi:phenylpropionate dioxygenase-like ring-hydroxylating dioxygenase large terminal subunit
MTFADRYHSREYEKLEWERMWRRAWLPAALSVQVPAPGDFLRYDLGRESLIVVRGDGGEAAAFFNVCQHRGNRLCAEPEGHAKTFRCGYHHWEWSREGTLRNAPGAALGDRMAGITLARVRTETRLGIVWVNLDGEAESIDGWLAPVAERISVHRPEQMSLQSAITAAVDCNWKISCEVHNEAYHLRTIHPELLPYVDLARVNIELLGRHSAIQIPLKGGPSRDKQQFYVFPNLQLNFVGQTLEVYAHRPAIDSRHAYFDQWFLEYAPEARAGRVATTRIRAGERSLGPVTDRDVEMLPGLQRGVESAGFAMPRYTAHEAALANMHRVLDEMVHA